MHDTLYRFLDRDAGAAAVMAHVRLLQKLSRRLAGALPSGLAQASRVANYKSGKLVIHADNGAVAAKIRQLGQRLCSELSKGGAECSALEVKVQPRQSSGQSMTSTDKPLSRGAQESLSGCLRGLPEDSPLRSALATLIERSARE